MTKQEFSKTVKILKSRVSATGFINISYVHILSNNAVSTERKVCIEKVGGALNSLYTYVVCG